MSFKVVSGNETTTVNVIGIVRTCIFDFVLMNYIMNYTSIIAAKQ